MMDRYIKNLGHIGNVDHDEAKDLLLTEDEYEEVKALLRKFRVLKFSTEALQDESVTISEARSLFDAAIRWIPHASRRLGAEDGVVENLNFENYIVKIQSHAEGDLRPAKLRGVNCLTRDGTVAHSAPESSTTTSLAEKVLKRMRYSNSERVSNYMDLRFIQETSNILERLFPKEVFALTDRRRRLFTSNVECQLY